LFYYYALIFRDKRETTSHTEYLLSDMKGRTLCRHPETVSGQPVTIQKCQVCKYFCNIAMICATAVVVIKLALTA